MTEKITPTPWQYYWREDEAYEGQADCGIFSEPRKGQAYSIARCPRYQTKEKWEADASLICRAVNAHDELVAALKAHDEYMLDAGYEGPESKALHPKAAENWCRVRAALAKAEGKS